MRQTKNTKDLPECRNGCLSVVRILVLHLVVAEAVARYIPTGTLLALCVYVTGLILGLDPSAAAIAAAIPVVSHDQLTRMLTDRWWSQWALTRAGVALANRLGDGWLILDDVHIPKPYAKLIAFCAWDFDHATNRNSFGIRLVVLVWSNGVVTIPLGFLVWQKDPAAKPRRKGKKRGRKRKTRRPRQTAADKRAAARTAFCTLLSSA